MGFSSNNFRSDVKAYVLPLFFEPTIKQEKKRGGKFGFLDCGSLDLVILNSGVGNC